MTGRRSRCPSGGRFVPLFAIVVIAVELAIWGLNPADASGRTSAKGMAWVASAPIFEPEGTHVSGFVLSESRSAGFWTDEAKLDRFRKIAFRPGASVYRPDALVDEAEIRLLKWMRPVHVGVVEPTGESPSFEDLVKRHVSEIAKASNHNVRFVGHDERINVLIIHSEDPYSLALGKFREFYRFFFSSEEKMVTQTEVFRNNFICSFKLITKSNTDYQIVGGILLIPTDLTPEDTELCVGVSLMRAMGLIETEEHSYASNDQRPTDFLLTSKVDLELLEILYSPELQPGMSWSEAEPIARRLIGEVEH